MPVDDAIERTVQIHYLKSWVLYGQYRTRLSQAGLLSRGPTGRRRTVPPVRSIDVNGERVRGLLYLALLYYKKPYRYRSR
jgi:hypothetical protein